MSKSLRGAWGTQLEQSESRQIEKALSGFALFSGIPEGDVRILIERSFFLSAGPDRAIVFRGDQPGGVYVLLSGTALEEGGLVAQGEFRHDFSWINRILVAGDTFGELPEKLQHPQPYNVLIRETGDLPYNLMIIPPEVLGDFLERYRRLADLIYRESTASRLRSIPALQTISSLDLRYLALMVEERRLQSGAEMPESDADIGSLWMVNQGRIAAFEFPRESPRKSTGPDWYLSAGQVFVLSESPVGEPLRLYRAVMETDVSLYRISYDTLQNLYEKTPKGKGLSSSLEHVDPGLEIGKLSHPPRSRRGCFLDIGLGMASPEFLKILSGYVGWEYVPQWEEVVRQGERANKLYVLFAGEAIIKATDKDGRERPRSYLPDPVFHKCHFGMKSLLYTGERDITVEATTNTEWFSISHEDFVRLGEDLSGRPEGKEFEEWKKNLEGLGEGAKEEPGFVEKVLDRVWSHLLPDEGNCYQKVELSPGEAPEFCTWKHWWIFARKWILYSLVALLFLVGINVPLHPQARNLSEVMLQVVLPALPVFVLIFIALGYLISRDYFNDFLVVTDRRVIMRDQLLLFGLIPVREYFEDIPLQHIQDIKMARRGIVRRFLDVGVLYIQSAGGTIIFPDVGNPNGVRDRIFRIGARIRRLQAAKYKEELRREIKNRVMNVLSPFPPSTALPQHPLVQIPSQKGEWERVLNVVKDGTGRVVRWIKVIPKFFFPRRPEFYSPYQQKQPKEVVWRYLFFPLRWEEGDRIIWRKHWVKLYEAIGIPSLLLVSLVAVMMGFVVSPAVRSALSVLGIHQTTAFLLFSLLLLADLIFLFVRYQDWSNDLYILDKTMLHDINKGILSINVRDVVTPLSRIQSVKVSIGDWKARFLGYGTIEVSTAAAGGSASFEYLPHPYEVRNLIMRRVWELAESQKKRMADEDRERILSAMSVYEEMKKKRPAPPRIWHKPYKSGEHHTEE